MHLDFVILYGSTEGK